MRRLALLAALATTAFAEEGVRITFLPPPLDGTLSAGIYTIDGKLTRVLANEVHDDAFVVGLNGLITNWDGKDDSGAPATAGKYFVRGYAVGEVHIEGVAFRANDWLEEDAVPRLRDLKSVGLDGGDLLVSATTAAGKTGELRLKIETGERSFAPQENAALAVTESTGAQGRVWKIEDGTLVQRKGDEVLRQLAMADTEPQPFAVAAVADRDELFLLERNEHEVRLRGLRLKETKADADGKAVSEWEVFLSKSIAAQDTFAHAATALGRPQPPVAEDRVRIGLMRNELLEVAPAAIQIGVGFDAKGSFLRTIDGLPLRRVTATPDLKWATLTREADGSVTLFQSDGAVTEEYRLRKLDQMMAFDAGEYNWTPK
jgi:hypothetical protein